MPAAVKRDHELVGKGLVTVLMEGGSKGGDLDAFVLQNWPDCAAMWCENNGTPTPEYKGVPHAALIGADGKLVWDGSPLDGTVDQLILSELAKVQKGWGDDAESRKIRVALHANGELAAARKSIEAMVNEALKRQLLAEAETVFANAVRAVTFLQQDGRWADAQTRGAALSRGVAGVDEWALKTAELLASFETAAGRKELEASRKLARVERQIADRKLRATDGTAVKALKDVAKSGEGTKAAERALMLATALENKTR